MSLSHTTIDNRELSRLQAVERAWTAVFETLRKHNNQAFTMPMTGTECAVAEIARLQRIEAAAMRNGT
jgi:hypothetical protein